MAYRIAVCDDNIKDAEYVRGQLTHWANTRDLDIAPEIFPSAESFLFRYAEDKRWDILLLDIEMGAMDGVTMAKIVRRDNEAVQIVFLTGYSDSSAVIPKDFSSRQHLCFSLKACNSSPNFNRSSPESAGDTFL